jgi:hypothetical protein
VRIAAIDPAEARDKRATPRNDLFADRRTDLWRDLLEAPAASGAPAKPR